MLFSTPSVAALMAFVRFAFGANGPSERYYNSLDCIPVLDPGETTPSRYDCGHIDRIKDGKCYAYGRHFDDGELLPKGLMHNKCAVNCRCHVYPETTAGKFMCAHIDCPFHRPHNSEENCYLQYSHESCCSIKEHCDQDDEVETCEYDGKIYKEGERFYPNDQPCQSCICMKGFDGTIGEPWCKSISCDLYIHYGDRIREGCVPTYYKKDDCCPIPTWRCPADEADDVIGEPIATAKSEDHMCKFGKAKLSVGQSIQKDPDNPCVNCSCQTPPHITCVMNTTCYESR